MLDQSTYQYTALEKVLEDLFFVYQRTLHDLEMGDICGDMTSAQRAALHRVLHNTQTAIDAIKDSLGGNRGFIS